MSPLEVFVACREAPHSLANAFALGEGDVGEAGRVGEVVLKVLKLFIVHGFAGDGVGIVGNVEGVGVVGDDDSGVVVSVVVDAAVAAVVVLETCVDSGDCGRSREGGDR